MFSSDMRQSSRVRDGMIEDHDKLERLLDRVIEAFEDGDRERVATTWTEFDRDLQLHLAAEEQYLVPALLERNRRAAQAVLAEHQHFRARLTELGAGVDLHIVDLRVVRAFVDELRAHARHEDRVLYLGADEQMEEPDRTSLLQAVSLGRGAP
jgi:hemerythrin-like domain-containing protein